MTKPPSAIYSVNHPDLKTKIAAKIEQGTKQSVTPPIVFFRADDIGIVSKNFIQLIDCFKKHKLPLCLATAPSWTTQKRLTELQKHTGVESTQWCWHQHGRLHLNFEPTGKKQEFGPSRTKEEIRTSLQKGRNRLESLLGSEFFPVFTPPWNRCGASTFDALAELGFKAISRSKGALPKSPANLPDFQVNVDLHTRKEISPTLGMDNLLTELEQGLASGRCGIMLHHQRMNEAAFELLDLILELIKNHPRLLHVHFGEMIAD